jgi:hypothetical protein
MRCIHFNSIWLLGFFVGDNKSKEKSEKRASWGKIYIFAGEKGEKTCRTANWRNLS